MKIFCIIILVIISFSCHNNEESPRDLNGKTTLSTPDSIYYITFKIDSVVGEEHEPPERN